MRKRTAGLRQWAGVVAVLLAGCSTTAPYTGQGPHPQITRGHPNAVVDFIGNFFALPIKLILFTWRVDDHEVPAETEAYLVRYIDLPESVRMARTSASTSTRRDARSPAWPATRKWRGRTGSCSGCRSR
jgi:hypothetical protein